MKDLFSAVNGNYNLRFQSDFGVPGKYRYFGSVIWNILPNSLRNICNFDLFKTIIRRWKLGSCRCRLCKNYLDGPGFITA